MLHNSTSIGDQIVAGTPLRVLLCPDQPSWSFDNISNSIIRNSHNNSIYKLYMRDIIGNEQIFFEKILLGSIDVCHIFWREDLFYLLNPSTIQKAAQCLGVGRSYLVRAINNCAFTTSVYDHLFSSQEELLDRSSSFAIVDGYTVSSKKIYDIYAAEPELPKPDAIIPDGVDIACFTPSAYERRNADCFVIGWAGNSSWGKQSQKYDVKGYDRIFRPMMDELRGRGFVVEERVANPQIKRIKFEDMPDFYRGLDLFVCTSAIEGTPNTVLEAMACGIPVVSTDVGIVSDALGDLQKRFIMSRANTGTFSDGVAELLGNGSMRRDIGKENRLRALDWSWEIKTKDWWPFWHDALKRASNKRHAARREMYLLSMISGL